MNKIKNTNKNKISRYNLIGINNISSSYVQSISKMGLIDKNQEKEYAINIIENKNKLIKELFSTPYIAELFLKHFNKTRSSIIHAKYVFELSKYISNVEDEDDIDEIVSDDNTETKESEEDKDIKEVKKPAKKNIFNDINNIINTKIKKYIDEITSILLKISQKKHKTSYSQLLEALSSNFTNIHLSENIIKEMYTIYIDYKAEINATGIEDKLDENGMIFGLTKEDFDEKYKRIKEYYKNMLFYTEKMILSNLRLVISVSKKYVNKRTDFMDIVQEGNLGLVKAIKKFDYARGYKFSTYATWWIKQAITRAMYEKCEAVRVPVHMKEHISKVFKNIGSISENLNYDEKIKEVAKYTALDEKKIKKVFKIQRGYVNLDKSSNETGDDDAIDFIDNRNHVTPYSIVVAKDKRRIINELIQDLNPREKDIFRLRFMDNQYNSDKEMTLEMIGYLKGITRERVRQIIHKIILRLLLNSKNSKYKDIIFG